MKTLLAFALSFFFLVVSDAQATTFRVDFEGTVQSHEGSYIGVVNPGDTFVGYFEYDSTGVTDSNPNSGDGNYSGFPTSEYAFTVNSMLFTGQLDLIQVSNDLWGVYDLVYVIGSDAGSGEFGFSATEDQPGFDPFPSEALPTSLAGPFVFQMSFHELNAAGNQALGGFSASVSKATLAEVPEPATGILLGGALCALYRRRRRTPRV